MKKMLVVVLLGLLSACSSVKVTHIFTAPNTNLANYKTFDFYQLKASGDTISKGFTDRMEVLKSAIAFEMIRRGYQQTSNHPQLLINIGLQVSSQTQTRVTDWQTDGAYRYMGQRNYSWKSEEVVVGTYKQGAVTLHLVDATQNTLVWKATVHDVLPSNVLKLSELAQTGMKVLFEKFPVPVQ
ncbi:MAG: DUF4136 domain-containing protein [Bacteroidetes bacterium]|nr:DUF4136 domain-containing protein [Bacteroidota bacterium]